MRHENSQIYEMLADEAELKWFFDHVIVKPQVNESYSMVFVSRHKKLTKEEQKTIGLTRKESEFLATQSLRMGRFKDTSELAVDEDNWTFDAFLKRVRRFEVNKYAYTTALGEPIPSKTLAIIFYVNPCDDMVVADMIVDQIKTVKTGIAKAMLNGKDISANLQSYQLFGNLENNLKHFKAQCKGSSYWIDYDLDVPAWFKERHYDGMKAELGERYGKGNYVIVDTSGGYHILVRTAAIRSNPNEFCVAMTELYESAVAAGEEPYVDDKGQLKFECILNGSHQTYNPDAEREVKEMIEHLETLQASGAIAQREFKVLRRNLYESLKTRDNKSSIPGIPLPGTYQYDRPVVVLNKEDFE